MVLSAYALNKYDQDTEWPSHCDFSLPRVLWKDHSYAARGVGVVGFSYLPAANAEQKAHDIALLLFGELLEVLVGAHLQQIQQSAYVSKPGGGIILRSENSMMVPIARLVSPGALHLHTRPLDVGVVPCRYFVGVGRGCR